MAAGRRCEEPSDDERFIKGLVAALPEAFVDVDLLEDYDFGGGSWHTTRALGHATGWIESHALDVDYRAQTVNIRPSGPELLRRFFDYIETVIADAAGPLGWIQVELFPVVWTEDVLDYLGPLTTELFRDAQQTLTRFYSCVGSWPA